MATLVTIGHSSSPSSFGSLVHPAACRGMSPDTNDTPKWAQGESFRRRGKREVAESFIEQLRKREGFDVDAPGFIQGVLEHFDSLPSRYAFDVNIESLDVLNHKRLLDSARAEPSAVSFQVRPVDVITGTGIAGRVPSNSFLTEGSLETHQSASLTPPPLSPLRHLPRPLPRPAFGSSPNLQALVLEAEERMEAQASSNVHASLSAAAVFYEVTIASIDQPKLLSRLSECLGDIGLNICEAHAFNTRDHYSLDVFVVNGWFGGGSEEFEETLSQRLQELPPPLVAGARGGAAGARDAPAPRGAQEHSKPLSPLSEQRVNPEDLLGLQREASGAAAGSSLDSDWELEPSDVMFHEKIASGAFGDLYRGSYCGQDVAIKILRAVQGTAAQFSEFLQEIAIMRKVRHKNVVQFIGACTKKPNLCIVFEYMQRGSVYEYIRKTGPLRVSQVLKFALEVCRGMDYLHKRRIVHRDLKAANLLLDETGVVKIADFGVARVLDHTGVMTAETGTYRWMAPEVIEHQPYGVEADVFSFGIVLWELLTGRVPYADMTPLQAAVGVVQKGLRPPLPLNCPPALAETMRACWVRDPAARPTFEQLKARMEELYNTYRNQDRPEALVGVAAPAPPSAGPSPAATPRAGSSAASNASTGAGAVAPSQRPGAGQPAVPRQKSQLTGGLLARLRSNSNSSK
uniref:non-specific serine/threonine protein kinase n=1 Tax=Auxenochlorella protothecoides TaxID=3075 RepID=A0A1D1ZPD5_AUXPR